MSTRLAWCTRGLATLVLPAAAAPAGTFHGAEVGPRALEKHVER